MPIGAVTLAHTLRCTFTDTLPIVYYAMPRLCHRRRNHTRGYVWLKLYLGYRRRNLTRGYVWLKLYLCHRRRNLTRGSLF